MTNMDKWYITDIQFLRGLKRKRFAPPGPVIMCPNMRDFVSSTYPAKKRSKVRAQGLALKMPKPKVIDVSEVDMIKIEYGMGGWGDFCKLATCKASSVIPIATSMMPNTANVSLLTGIVYL